MSIDAWKTNIDILVPFTPSVSVSVENGLNNYSRASALVSTLTSGVNSSLNGKRKRVADIRVSL